MTRVRLARLALLLVLAEITPSLGWAVEVNLRDFGAMGDGRVHLAADAWVGRGRKFKSFNALVRQYPFVKSREWTVDEVAWRLALAALPSEGGTIRVPPGHYVAKAEPWMVQRNDVRLLGAGAEQTIFSTATAFDRSFELAGYRHVGWEAAAAQSYPFTDDSGARGAEFLKLRQASWAADWNVGDLVFIRAGACRFDQDFGEMNEVAGVEADGRLILRHPLARSYLPENLAWSGQTAEPWVIPPVRATAWVTLTRGDRLFMPARYDAVTIDGALFQAVAVHGARVKLQNPGRGNPAPGTPIPAGARVAKSRVAIRLTASTRGFRAEGISFRGPRTPLSISNSYDSEFVRCWIERDARGRGVKGGLVLDGDGGRFAKFVECRFIGHPPSELQIARSYGDLWFERCEFLNTRIGFTEFTFLSGLRDSQVTLRSRVLGAALVIGASCNDLEVTGNAFEVADAAVVFDAHLDIQSHRAQGHGPLVVERNTLRLAPGVQTYRGPGRATVELRANRVEPLPASASADERHANPPPGRTD